MLFLILKKIEWTACLTYNIIGLLFNLSDFTMLKSCSFFFPLLILLLIWNCGVSIWVSVQKPREQVADAEALQDIANSLVTSIRSQSNEGVTPSDFVSCLLREFAQIGNGVTSEENDMVSVSWKDIGRGVSSIFMNGHGCCTMWDSWIPFSH